MAGWKLLLGCLVWFTICVTIAARFAETAPTLAALIFVFAIGFPLVWIAMFWSRQ